MKISRVASVKEALSDQSQGQAVELYLPVLVPKFCFPPKLAESWYTCLKTRYTNYNKQLPGVSGLHS